MDPAMLSINTGRGIATHTLVRYAWWQSKGAEKFQRRSASSCRDMRIPTLSRLSECTRRSAGGSRSSALDRQWMDSCLRRVFPADNAYETYWRAAWDSFVLFDRPTTAAFELLHPDYVRAFGETLVEVEAERHRRDRIQATARHVLAYLLWGLETLDADDTLLEASWRKRLTEQERS